jgi:hypothetical protein
MRNDMRDDMRESHDDKNDRVGLEALGTVEPPRRSDAAFARSVVADVEATRRRWWQAAALLVPGTAMAVAVAVVFIGGEPSTPDGLAQASASDVATIDDEGTVLDSLLEADADPFTLPDLDGSSERELLAFEAQLDAALSRHKL